MVESTWLCHVFHSRSCCSNILVGRAYSLPSAYHVSGRCIGCPNKTRLRGRDFLTVLLPFKLLGVSLIYYLASKDLHCLEVVELGLLCSLLLMWSVQL